MARKRSRTRNAVLFHHPDAVDTGRARLLGRHSAGEGFLKGFVRHSGVPAFYAQALGRDHFDDFQRRVQALDDNKRPCHWVPFGAMANDEPGEAQGEGKAETPATLMLPDPMLAPFAWRRRGIGDRAYSICGVTHTIASDRVMDGLGELLTAPVQPWDAAVCTSESTRAAVVRLLDNWADYLGRRTGGKVEPKLQLPVIPLGVDCDAFVDDDKAASARRTIRRGLGIGDDDVAVLFLGRLSFHAKAHPTPLYLALEEAAKRTGKRLHLLQAGWFANDGIERDFRDGLLRYAPSINGIFLDGRRPDVRFKVWFAADVFTSLSDNIQETFGLTPIEAMAAGLPVVVSDWDGYRDTVRTGIDGFTIPTWMPLPESGGDLGLAPEARLTMETSDQAYEQYCGVVSQATAVDIAAAAEAFAALAADPALRRRMGEAGRKRARQAFDWRVVVRQYQDLWRDLENVRNRDKAIAPLAAHRPPVPLRDDPFSLYAAHPTHTLDGKTLVALAAADQQGNGKGGWAKRLQAIGRQRMNVFAAYAFLGDDDQRKILAKLADHGPAEVLALADLLPEDRRYRLTRTLAWLAKMGIVRLQAGKGGRSRSAGLGAKASGKPTAWTLVEQGIAARRRGALGDAQGLFERALAAEPDDAVVRTQLGELAAFAGRLGDARESFEKALASSPSYQPAQRNLGKVLFVEGDYPAARAALARAADMTPGDLETRYLLGIACRYAGRAEEAIPHLEAALERDTGTGGGGDTLAQLGLAFKSLGCADDAVEKFEAALAREPGHVVASTALLTMKAAERGRQALEKGGKRIALYVHAKFHAPHLRPLFEAFQDGHWPAISADARDAAEFDPMVTVICDAPVQRLAAMMPKAATVNIRHTLAGRNFAGRHVRHADFVCVPGTMMRDRLVASGTIPGSRVWVTGYAANDPLFRGDQLPLPFKLPRGLKTVLYAPTHYPPFSSASMLGVDAAALIAGDRDDVTVIIKPHPSTCELRPDWIAAWARAAEANPRVHLVGDPVADVVPYLMAADALVSDASGVIFQYLALDRPIVLIANPAAASDEARYDPDAIEWRWRDVGEEVADVKKLAAAVERALADPDAGAERRAEYRRLLFDDLTDGRAGQRIVEKVSTL